MNTVDYKERFINLFKEMEKDLGKCDQVHIERDDEYEFGGEVVKTTYSCKLKF